MVLVVLVLLAALVVQTTREARIRLHHWKTNPQGQKKFLELKENHTDHVICFTSDDRADHLTLLHEHHHYHMLYR